MVKTNPWTYEIKNLNRKDKKKITKKKKKLLLTKLPWNYYPSPDTHVRDKVRVVLDLTNYSTKKEFNSVIGTDTSNL